VRATTWLLVVVLCSVQFLDVLGTTLLVVALPSLQREMGLSSGTADLLAGLFALFFGSLLILGGKLADVYGARRVLVAGMGLFTVASAVGGMATSPLLLFAGRAGQGISAALAVPAAMSLLTALFPPGPRRNTVLGVWTAAGAVGGAAGFALGGVVTDMLGWRWVFLLNVPIAAVALMVVWSMTASGGDRAERHVIDIRGALLLTSGLLALILGLSRLRTSSGGADLAVNFLMLPAAVVLLAAFVTVERSTEEPVLPLWLLRLRTLVGASMVAFILTFTTTAASVILTMYLQRVLGFEATRAGMLLSPVSGAVIAGSAIGSRLLSRRGFGAPMVAGLVAIAISMLLFVAGMQAGTVRWIIVGLVISGLGLGCASVASTSCGLSRVDEAHRGTASGAIASSAMLGTAMGIAILGAIAQLGTSILASRTDQSRDALTVGYELAILVAAALAMAMIPVAIWGSARAGSDVSEDHP
jgi:MFS family permease